VNDRSLTWIHEVRHRLESPAARRLPPDEVRRAAVLVPLYVERGEMLMLLTQRSQVLPSHKGQIAFPGGAVETGEGAWEAALRETREEIGLDPDLILRLGELDELTSPAGFRIVPCVGAVPAPVKPVLNEEEIDRVFAVPLLALADPGVVEDREVDFDGRRRAIRVYHIGQPPIWGLTARIIQRLLERLGLGMPAA
jgi:8-oxo-dGTP pyrophosphatase MutT (NUDIX family)